MKRDVAIVGAGYVGVPLARTFADAGKQRAARRRRRRARCAAQRRRELHRGRPGGGAEATRRGRARRRDDRLRRAPGRGRHPHRAPHTDLPPARARPAHPPLRHRADRPASSCGTSGRAGVDHIPGHHTRAGAADSRARQRPDCGKGLPSRVLTRARRSRARGLDDEERAQGGRGDRRGVDRRGGRSLLGRDRRDPPRLLAGGGRAHEAPREHLPLGQHRPRQRARAAVRPDGHRRVGGDRSGRDEAVRVHVVQARSRPRRSLHPDRSLLPHVEGAGVRLLHRVHRARREGQRVDAVLLPVRSSRRRSTTNASAL